MVKYIDAEKLKAHIKAKMKILWDKLPDADKEHPTDIELRDLGMYMALEGLIDDLDSLQQEKEIDLDEKITKYWKDISSIYGAVGKEITRFDFDDACKYFYELGLNARKV